MNLAYKQQDKQKNDSDIDIDKKIVREDIEEFQKIKKSVAEMTKDSTKINADNVEEKTNEETTNEETEESSE